MKKALFLLFVLLLFIVSNNKVFSQTRELDSLVLVDLYEATNGDNWIDATNWLSTEPINTWHGIQLTDNGRVLEIDLADNNLTGTLPSTITNISLLEVLDLSENSITGNLPDLSSMSELSRLYIGNNLLTFNDIYTLGIVTGDISTFTYAPQDTSLAIEYIVNDWTLTVLDSNFEGNEYSWNKDEAPIDENTRTIIAPGQGDYECEVTHPLFPLLTLNSEEFSLIYNGYTDSLALAALYNATNGDNWSNKTNWFVENDLNDWNGITTDVENRVTKVTLSNNELKGQIPEEITCLTHLIKLDLKNNQLTGSLNPLNRIETVDTINVENNHFVFANLSTTGLKPSLPATLASIQNQPFSPNFAPPLYEINEFTYNPQDTLLHLIYNEYEGTITVNDGADVNNEYLWFIDGITNETYSTRSILADVNGDFHCEVTNSNFPELILSTDTVTFGFSIVTDSLALVHLFNDTDGDNWDDNSNWLSGNVSTWEGIVVEEDRVTEIDLHANGLVGSIPFEIGNISHLTKLILSDNQLSGSIPSEIGLLTNLIKLKLNSNQLSGNIPTEIEEFINLTNLRLDNNLLDGNIPTGIEELTELTNLNLSHNQLNGSIPTGIGSLTNLYWLSLNNNLLRGSIPSSLASLGDLSGLELDHNQLDGNISVETGTFNNLTYLALDNNQFDGNLPDFPSSLSQLNYLSLGNNMFTGSIPTSIAYLTNLVQLDLQANQLDGEIPTAIQFLTSLTSLSLNNNSLSGSIPTGMETLTSLNTLSLENNLLEGDMPSFSSITNLSELSVHNNLFTFSNLFASEISPEDIDDYIYYPQDTVFGIEEDLVDGTLTVLDDDYTDNEYAWYKNEILTSETSNTIYMDSEGAYNCIVTNPTYPDLTLFSDTFNYEYSLFTDSIALVKLYEATEGDTEWLSNNGWLNGNIDTWQGIDTLNQRVINIDLSANNLTGNLPIEIGNLTHLINLNLQNNEIGGNLPVEIGNLTLLTNLNLTNNEFDGSIPSTMGKLNSLITLSLNGNLLTGNIPSEIGSLTNIEYLHLNSNNLNGELPIQLGNLNQLKTLNLSNNDFLGELPIEMCSLSNLLYLYLSINQFEGAIPQGFEDFDKLKTLNIDNNKYQFYTIETIFEWSNFEDIITFTYSPQATIGRTESFTAALGAPFEISIDGYNIGENDVFAWYKNDLLLPAETDTKITISAFQSNDEGIYHCIVTNNVANALTLTSFPITVTSGTVPGLVSITNETFINGENRCLNALDNIIIAGNSSTVNFLSGSYTSLIAGNSIQFLPGFYAHSGSYATATITTNGSFCSPNPAIVAANNQIQEKSIIIPLEVHAEEGNQIVKNVKVYPNPSNGRITIALDSFSNAIQFSIVNMQGALVKQFKTIGESQFDVDLSDQTNGIYLIRISDEETMITKKIIIN